MTPDRHLPTERDDAGDGPAPELRRALDRWSVTPARAEFEEQLRARFLGEAVAPAAPAAPKGSVMPRPRAVRRAPVARRRPRPAAARERPTPWGPIATVLAVAAAIALFWFRPTAQRAAWHPLAPQAGATVLVDGVRFAQSDASGLAAALAVGRTLRTGEHEFAARFGELFALHLDPNSTVQVLAAPGRDETVRFATMDTGSGLSVATGPGFAGMQLTVETPDANVRVVGTAFAIHPLGDAGTCVCCTHGDVAVHVRTSDAKPCGAVAQGGAGVFQDGADVYSGEALPAHIAALERLRAAWDL